MAQVSKFAAYNIVVEMGPLTNNRRIAQEIEYLIPVADKTGRAANSVCADWTIYVEPATATRER